MEYSDFLVVGSGIAGLMYALEVAQQGNVTVICKGEPSEGNTRYAQGGIASVTSPLDSFEAHIRDTLESGAGLCHDDVVRMVVSDGPESIARLIDLGTHFDTHTDSQNFDLGREGGHSQRRILHSRDRTGAEIQRAIFEQALRHPRIKILPYHVAIDLILSQKPGLPRPEVVGVYALDQGTGIVSAFSSRATMLATGGVGKVYLYTSNPDVSTGDGIAMAFRAGARISNMEFIQFHPTCLFHPQAKTFLLTEALRGEGAQLLNLKGERFVIKKDPRGELAPRDIVARAIDEEMKESGSDYVLLDISFRDPEFIRSRFPTITETLNKYGFDLTKGPVPVVPAAHYCCGGVLTDKHGSTDLPRLYAAGEVAHTGLHGANRLASNSLLEAVVFAHRAAVHTLATADQLSTPQPPPEWDYLDTVKSSEEVIVSHTWDELRRVMWNLVGISRSDRRLNLAHRRIAVLKEEIRDYYWKYRVTGDLIELRNIIQVAEIIVTSAASRRESRGLHYNVDCPDRDDVNWLHDTVVVSELEKR